ncbi:hypothetical protein PROFUN_11403 [Planoprotostelium fungivorum]|uniref:Selenide, water dikinase n=1 Tax=Planoprotostelium fungivorum TaxID=1890364 RepID=A0A2P6NA69_9EUKA|nr:hypothetical protein PROFUN_11403 [Planoprotostelium fungivorum]
MATGEEDASVVPQVELLKLLEGIGGGKIGMDCSITPLRQKDLFMVSTTDFFYPLVDDPYMQGKIGCANVLSDLYAMGVVDCDNLLMILAASNEMEKEERNISTRLMIQGFNDQAESAGTSVTGGQTVINPWPIIGGTASSVCSRGEFITPDDAREGDVLVLTKPLGIQIAVNVHQWKNLPAKADKYQSVLQHITEEEADQAYRNAVKSMSRLNKNAARLMHKYGAHAATDVTGFGILGHARNLAQNQKRSVDFHLHTLPILRGMAVVDEKVNSWGLLRGVSAETSGGLFIALPSESVKSFCSELEQLDGSPVFIVVARGDDEKGNCVIIREDYKLYTKYQQGVLAVRLGGPKRRVLACAQTRCRTSCYESLETKSVLISPRMIDGVWA